MIVEMRNVWQRWTLIELRTKAIAGFSVFQGCFGNSAMRGEKKTISAPAAKENLLFDFGLPPEKIKNGKVILTEHWQESGTLNHLINPSRFSATGGGFNHPCYICC